MILAGALILDALLGEPGWLWRRLPHPVVLMGRQIAWLDRRLNNRTKPRGIIAVVIILATGLAAGWAISMAGPIVEVIAAAILLAQKSLMQHVRAVADGLRQGLEPGRRAVAQIVGRDPQSLDEAGVARAAVESAAENFSDGVVAPAFWFLLLGLPGMLALKFVNTADSMIGYRSERHLEFGWAAARLDDLMNWPPARLSALLIAFAARRPSILRRVPAEAGKHASPNAGWPEAATALSLGFALAGPRLYASGPTSDPVINGAGRRRLDAGDIERSQQLIWRAWALLLLVALAAGVASTPV